MNSNLPLNNSGLSLLAINGTPVATAPAQSISLLKVISVLPATIVNYSGATVSALRVTVAGIKNQPDTYDFALSGETTASATAGFTVGTVTTGDAVSITINGVVYTYTTVAGDTAATILAAVLSLLSANTQGFTVTGVNTTGVVLYTLTGPANSSALNGFVVVVTCTNGAGSTFGTPVETNFAGGSGVAEQFLAFIDSLSLTAYLPVITGLKFIGSTPVKNLPSFMLNSEYIQSSSYNSTFGTTDISYKAPLNFATDFIAQGNQTAVSSTFNV